MALKQIETWKPLTSCVSFQDQDGWHDQITIRQEVYDGPRDTLDRIVTLKMTERETENLITKLNDKLAILRKNKTKQADSGNPIKFSSEVTMATATKQERVIFRRFRDGGDIIAIFPD